MKVLASVFLFLKKWILQQVCIKIDQNDRKDYYIV